MATPTVQYARAGGVDLAYMVTGDGPVDLLYSMGNISHIEHLWEEPGLARFFERMAGFARLILFDRRGTGMSGPAEADATLSHDAQDLITVLDAAGSERAFLMGYVTGGAVCVDVAVHHPERVAGLIFYAAVAKAVAAPGYEFTHNDEERAERIETLIAGWGTGANLTRIAPSRDGDDRLRTWSAKLERLSSSPSNMRRLAAAFREVDVRDLLPQVTVPTLILHRSGDQLIDVRHSRYLAAEIPGARYVELPGTDNLPSAGDMQALLGEIEEFVTGERSRPDAERELLTVLFTDIVDATARAAALGDKAWRDLLAEHDAVVRTEIARYGGREVNTIGDAFLVTFDGTPSRAVRCARSVLDATERLGLQLRAGLHTGECELIGDDVGGMAVHIAARVSALAQPGQVLASGTTYGTVIGSGLQFAWVGDEQLKGVSDTWPIFRLEE